MIGKDVEYIESIIVFDANKDKIQFKATIIVKTKTNKKDPLFLTEE
jgi:hypothetical protein